jgi:hypothetical protein
LISMASHAHTHHSRPHAGEGRRGRGRRDLRRRWIARGPAERHVHSRCELGHAQAPPRADPCMHSFPSHTPTCTTGIGIARHRLAYAHTSPIRMASHGLAYAHTHCLDLARAGGAEARRRCIRRCIWHCILRCILRRCILWRCILRRCILRHAGAICKRTAAPCDPHRRRMSLLPPLMHPVPLCRGQAALHVQQPRLPRLYRTFRRCSVIRSAKRISS